MREATRGSHREAERSGVIAELLTGQLALGSYVLYLRNLVHVYRALESALLCHSESPGLGDLVPNGLFRSAPLASDLGKLTGPGWESGLKLLNSARRYSNRITLVSKDGGHRLIAHAYVRYLGDLNGGQLLARILSRKNGFRSDQLAFYRFDDIEHIDTVKRRMIERIDWYGTTLIDPGPIVEEAERAFRFNIDLAKEASQQALQPGSQRRPIRGRPCTTRKRSPRAVSDCRSGARFLKPKPPRS